MNLEECEDALLDTDIKQEVDEFNVTPSSDDVYLIKQEDTVVVKTETEITEIKNDQTTYECNRCTFCTLSLEALEEHKSSGNVDACKFPSNLKAESCKWCKYRSNHTWLMIRHVSDDHTSMLREYFAGYGYRGCTFCRYTTTVAEEFSEHIKAHVQGHKCDKCPSTFFSMSVLEEHKKKSHVKDRKSTEYFKGTKEWSFEDISANPVYSCTECPLSYQTKAELVRHRFYVHTQKDWYECKYCEFRTPFPEVIRKHAAHTHSKSSEEMEVDQTAEKKIATKKYMYNCNYCAFKSQQLGKYGNHMQAVHNILETQNGAPKAVSVRKRKRTVVLPKVTLRIQQPAYKCPTCNVYLASKELLKEHQENTTEQSDLLKTTEIELNPKPHTYVKQEKKRFKCDECDFRGSDIGHLRKHKTKHSGEKVCQCHVCGLTFSRHHYLMQHLRRHTGEKPYVCKICDYRAVQIGSLMYHLKSTHKVRNDIKMDSTDEDLDSSTE